MKKDIYSYLSILAMVAVPIAPAFYFGFDVAQEIYNLVFGWVQVSFVAGIFAVLIGLGAVVGLELVGILSGHNIVKYFSLGMNKIAAVCGLILIAYVVLGIIGLENVLTKGVVMFLTAPLVYVLATMQQTAANIDTKRNENEQVLLEFELAEKAKDNELKRQVQASEAKNALQIQLAKEENQKEIAIATEKAKVSIANAKARETKAKVQNESAKVSETFAETKTKPDELSGNKLQIYKLFQEKPNASNTEIAESIGVSRQYVGQVKKELNGSIAN